MARPAYTGAWPHVRRLILERDGHACQIHMPGCTGRATQVDHIVPLAHGGPRLDPANLRASCGHCNVARGNQTSPRGPHRPLPPARWWG